MSGGIIPARAGFTARPHGPGRRGSDHPRSRGVYWRRSGAWLSPPGSSPLARGLRDHGLHGQLDSVDHPRSRGVYAEELRARAGAGGSSPLARGLRIQERHILNAPGIIPARAGFTPWSAPSPSRTADHPRSRGVYRASWASRASRAGSSPLARGLHMMEPIVHDAHGIIPARAGFTK